MLLLVAAIPLAGTARLTWSSVDDAGTIVDRATATSEIAQHAVALARLDSSLFGEMIWAAADAVATSMQVPRRGLQPGARQ